MLIITVNTKFPLGQMVVTRNALTKLTPEEINSGLHRHAKGDWGNICLDDAALNNEALKVGDRLLSAYGSGKQKFWIITEADRSVTTVLLPEDY